MLVPVANCWPARSLLKGQSDGSLGCELETVGRVEHKNSQPQCHNQSQDWLASSLEPHYFHFSGPHVICSRHWHRQEASCHFLPVDIWYWFPLQWDKIFGASVAHMLTCQWWLSRGLMCNHRKCIHQDLNKVLNMWVFITYFFNFLLLHTEGK